MEEQGARSQGRSTKCELRGRGLALGRTRGTGEGRRPDGLRVLRGVVGEAAEAGAIGVHEVELAVAIAFGGEGEASAVRRPRRVKVVGAVAREADEGGEPAG